MKTRNDILLLIATIAGLVLATGSACAASISGTGFSADAIAEKEGTTPDDVTNYNGLARWVWAEAGSPFIDTTTATVTVPDSLDRTFTSDFGTEFELQPYDQDNILLNGDTFTLDTPGGYADLQFLIFGIGGNSADNFQATVNFSDASSTLLTFSISDWQASRPYNARERTAIARRGAGGWNSYFGPGVYPREISFDLSPADQAKVIQSIDFTLVDRLAVAAVNGTALNLTPPVVRITDVHYDGTSGHLSISWESKGGKLYNLRTETALSAGEPATWPIFDGNEDLVASPPENTLTFPLPADTGRFFVVEERDAPPVVVFSENFDAAAALPPGWTTGPNPGDTGTTVWEVGVPSVGPNGAQSAPNCAGTNLVADYGIDTDIYLRTPAIDLTTAGGATVSYQQFFDIEPSFDRAQVKILNAADDSELAVLVDALDGGPLGWEPATHALPAAVLGHQIKIEFRLEADNFGVVPGFYVDDVQVTVP